MSNSIRVIIFLLVFGCCWLFIDGLLPTEEIDTHVHHVLKTDGSMAYEVPDSGGELDTCSGAIQIEGQKLRDIQPNTEIVVRKTMIFGRCVGVKTIRCIGFVCSSGSNDVVNADGFIQNAIHYSYANKYQNVRELKNDYPEYLPEIRRWPNIRGWFSPMLYSVRLPEELVILDKNGNALTSRKCRSDEGFCQKVPLGQNLKDSPTKLASHFSETK